RLFLFSAANQVRVLNGTDNSMATLTAVPSDWSGGAFPTFGVLHSGRIFAGGNSSDPHRIYYSTIGNHRDFSGTGAGTLPVYPGEGEAIVGGMSFRGALVL